MDESSRKNETYEEFQERVKRTVLVDNLSPQVTEQLIRTAFDQYVAVEAVEFITDYLAPEGSPCAALVELKSEQAVKTMVHEVSRSPFMVGGMPRPVIARPAEEEMFEDRPRNPNMKITFQWLEKSDPKFEAAMKMKNMTRKHADEARFLLERKLEQEEKLANRQEQQLKAINKKYEAVDGVQEDGTAKDLIESYNVRKGRS